MGMIYCYNLYIVICLICLCFKDVFSIRCYNCHGVTNYDPTMCFDPTEPHTFVLECPRGSICEKKVVKLSENVVKIERGCSSNCNGRSFIWADDFQAHCCSVEMCNGSNPHNGRGLLVWGVAVASVLWVLRSWI